MAEETQKKKKPRIVWRIFKWIGLVLLSLLLIAAIMLQAPLKVIALLLIFLSACTVLPKPARKWFWLSVGVVVIALIIWVFLPDDNEGWQPYTFDDELVALEAKRAVPDEENAALIYTKLFETLDIDFNQPEFFLQSEPSSTDDPWLSKDHPDTAEWLLRHDDTITTLIEVSKMEKCRFPIISNTMALGEDMEFLVELRRCAYLLVSAANNDLAEGKTDAALEKYFAVLGMAQHISQQPTIIDLLVSIAIEHLALGKMNRFVVEGNATQAHLRGIEEAFAGVKHDWRADLPRMLDSEKLMAKNLWAIAYEVNPKGKTRFTRATTTAIRARFGNDAPSPTYWQKKLIKTGTIAGWFFVPSTPQKAGEIIDASYEKLYAMAESDFNWEKEPAEPPKWLKLNYRFTIELLTNILGPSFYQIHDLYLHTTSLQNGCQIIIALRRHKNENGAWPQSLDEITNLTKAENFVDPINGGPFVYKPADDGFMLYSKGKNRIDDGGKNDGYADGSGADDELIWPRQKGECTPEEENADDE